MEKLMKNKWVMMCLSFIFLLASMLYMYKKRIESFQTDSDWPPDLLKRFQEYENSTFDNSYQFDMQRLQKQAGPKDVEYLLKNDKWPWSEETQHLYLDAIGKSTLLQVDPGEALKNVMQIYNENAMRQLLAWNTKEGEFLLGGVTLMNDNRKENENPDNNFAKELEPDMSIRCDGEKGMVWNSNNKKIPNADLPSVVPGFEFGDKGACNPCGPLADKPDYSCPFSLNINGDASVSPLWKAFWSS